MRVDATATRSTGHAPAVARAAERSTSSWLVAACLFVGTLTAVRIAFLWTSGLELDFEEAQYWLWAQGPAWGYYSKPPLVAWLIAATTGLCGDAEPCVRLSSPLLHAATALVVGAVGLSVGGPSVALWSAVTYATLPGVALSAVLVTTDVPLLLCWALALLALLRLLQTDRASWAVLCGLALGAGLLGKYSMTLFVPCLGVWLLLSGRRLRLVHLALSAAVAALLVAPNVAWNAAHEFGTVQHSLRRMLPGGNGLRLKDPLFVFVLGQLAILGPVPFGWLLTHLRFWRPRTDDRRLFLGCFTFIPLAVALVVSFVARANPNWGAPAYVAGTVLVVSEMMAAGRSRLLYLSVALNVAAGLGLYATLAAVPAIAVPTTGRMAPVAARLHGWDELGRRVAVRAAERGGARVLVDRRELLAVAAYYGRVPETTLVEWNPSGIPHSHFQLLTRIAPGDPGPFVFVSYRPRPHGVTKHFDRAEIIETVVVPLAPGLERTHWLFELRGFRGYRGSARDAPGPPTKLIP